MKRVLALLLCILCLPLSVFATDSAEYIKIEKHTYYDKTLAGFLSQLAGMLSGNEYKQSGGRYTVAMPDDWFSFCDGPYAGNTTFVKHADKHIKNTESGLFEVWIDDDFGVDIFNQYILEDMFREYGYINSRAVSDGWLKYGIWDMGGGQRQVGAYGLISSRYLLPSFAGNGEFGNMYSYLSEPYLATDTLGMNTGAMPESAIALAETFASVTGDRDNVAWAKFFAALMSSAYTESDIQTLIRTAAGVFPDGSYSASLIDEIFAYYRKYPDDWRKAFTEFEKNHYTEGITTGANTTVNCGFAVLTLLYGGGDYMQTARIGSLAGYDCESTCGIALSVLGIIGGTAILPDDVNALIWQDGKGTVVNLSGDEIPAGDRMHADNLPERILISDIVQKYISNFENILKKNGGYSEGAYYRIPKETVSAYNAIEIQNSGFESGTLSGFSAKGNCFVTPMTSLGKYAAKLVGDGEIYTTVKGLSVGKTYTLTAFIHATEPSVAYLFARDTHGGICASVCGEGAAKNTAYKSVKRSIVFTATAEEMEIGVSFAADKNANLQYATVDGFSLIETVESKAGNAIIDGKKENGQYTMLRTVLQADKAGEHMLKISFSNKNRRAVDARIIVNGVGYAAASLSQTVKHADFSPADCVYIPILLAKGHNTVSLSFGGYTVGIDKIALVDLNYR